MRFSITSLIAIVISTVLLSISILEILNIREIVRLPEYLDFLNLPSVGVIIGGVMLHVFISYPSKEVRKAIKSVIYVFSESAINENSMKHDTGQILEWQQMLRENKNKTRNELSQSLGNTFEGYLFTLISTNYRNEDIRELGEIKIEERYNKNLQTARVYQTMGTASPAFGMLGTLLGLILMLANFQDAEQLGLGLSFALMTTLYGLMFAHLFFFPMAVKMRSIANRQFFRERVMLEGILMLHEGKSPLFIFDKMNAFQTSLENGMPGLPSIKQSA